MYRQKFHKLYTGFTFWYARVVFSTTQVTVYHPEQVQRSEESHQHTFSISGNSSLPFRMTFPYSHYSSAQNKKWEQMPPFLQFLN